jgi:hypothetical protein
MEQSYLDCQGMSCQKCYPRFFYLKFRRKHPKNYRQRNQSYFLRKHAQFAAKYEIGDIGKNLISNIEAIVSLNAPLLERLDLSQNKITKVTPLRKTNFKHLKTLGLCKISNIQFQI